MTELTFPSTAFPAPPEVRIDVPPDWTPTLAPGAVLAAAASVEPGAFAANIVVTWSRFGPDYDLGVPLSTVEETSRRRSEGTVIGTKLVPGEEPRGWHEATFRHPEAGVLAQSHLLFLVRDVGHVDLVHGVATVGGEHAAAELEAVRAVLATLRAEPAAAAGGEMPERLGGDR